MSRPLRRQTQDFEALLDGELEGDTALAGLLVALRAPDQPEEMDGLAAAMSAFYTVGPAAHPATLTRPPVRPGARHRRAGRSLLVRLGTLCGGASLVGGVALAAYASHNHPAPGPGTTPRVGTASTPHAGAAVSGESSGKAQPRSVGRTSAASAPASRPVGGAGQPTDIIHPSKPAVPGRTQHSPTSKPTGAPSPSSSGPGNSDHTKHTTHPHPSPTHRGRPTT